jgi:hypothetical protein
MNTDSNLIVESESIQVTHPADGVALITIVSQPLGVLRTLSSGRCFKPLNGWKKIVRYAARC